MADNGRPNSLQASLAKAKAGRMSVDLTLARVELCGGVGYGERELLEKWVRATPRSSTSSRAPSRSSC